MFDEAKLRLEREKFFQKDRDETPIAPTLEYDAVSHGLNQSWMQSMYSYITGRKPNCYRMNIKGLRIVCISDSHGHHRRLDLPKGDILIHAGDYTKYGHLEHAEDFNKWLGELDFEFKYVIQGNHETNAEWKGNADAILSNAVLLRNQAVKCKGLTIYGSEFYHPCKGTNPNYDQIPKEVDIFVCHVPAKGILDNGCGCPALRAKLIELNPCLCVCGHEHDGRGVLQIQHPGPLFGTVFVNAATAGFGHMFEKQGIVVQF